MVKVLFQNVHSGYYLQGSADLPTVKMNHTNSSVENA